MNDLRSLFEDLAADAPVVGDIDRAIADATHRRRVQTRVVAVAAAVALLLTIAGVGWNARRATTEPSGRFIGPHTWTSTLFDYQFTFPAGWRLTPAETPWVSDPSGGWPEDSSRDVYQSPGKPLFIVTSQTLPPGMSDMQWLRSYIGDQAVTTPGSSGANACWPPAKNWHKQRLAGQVAYLHGEGEYCGFTEAVTFVGGHAYVFSGLAGVVPGVFSMERLREFMRSVTFLPASGPASPDSSG
jgi:hypothetical protein